MYNLTFPNLKSLLLITCMLVVSFTGQAKDEDSGQTISLEKSAYFLPIHVVGGEVSSVSAGTIFKNLTFEVEGAFYFPCNIPQSEDDIVWRFIARDVEKRDIYEIVQVRRPDAPSCLPVREPIIVKLRSKGFPFARMTAPKAFIVNAYELPIEY